MPVISVLRKVATYCIVLFLLQGCSFVHYYPGEENANTCRGFTYEQCTDKYGLPDNEILEENEITLIYYSGRSILSGYGIFRVPIHKERHVFILKANKIVDEYYVIQVTNGAYWMCGNISGHGDFCGSWVQKSCYQYNTTNTLLCGSRVDKPRKQD